MIALLAEREAQLELARAGGGERSVARLRERGKMLVRERIELLLDRDSPFLELSPLAGYSTHHAGGGGQDCVEAEMRRSLGHFAESGRFFHDITALSAARIPTVSLVFGSSTAGGAYQPGMSDYNIFIRGRSKVFLGGPPLVKMATGEDSTDEELGGAEMHATMSGLADYLAEEELDGLRMAREGIAHLNLRKLNPRPTI